MWRVEVGDLDNDDDYEIAAGTGEGYVFIFDAKTHEQLWKSGELVRDAHGLFIGDVDGDGDNDLVVGTGYKTDVPWCNVYVFDGKTRELLATIGPFDSRLRGMAIADIDGDSVNEIIFGSGVALGETAGEGYIRIYSWDGTNFTREWMSEDLGGDLNGLVVSDIEGDGTLEIVAGNGYRYRPGFVYIFRYKGFDGVGEPRTYEMLLMSEDVGPKAYWLVVGDVDADGINEIVVGNQPGYIWIFNAVTRELEWKSGLLGTDILGLTLYDVDLDGEVEIVAGKGGYQGKADFTSAYTTPHIFVINGKTHEVEAKLGEPDYISWTLQIIIVFLVIFLLVGVNLYFGARRPGKGGKARTEPDARRQKQEGGADEEVGASSKN